MNEESVDKVIEEKNIIIHDSILKVTRSRYEINDIEEKKKKKEEEKEKQFAKYN